jgi:hypothetical protein
MIPNKWKTSMTAKAYLELDIETPSGNVPSQSKKGAKIVLSIMVDPQNV